VARLLELARLLVSRLLVALLGVSRLLVALLGVSRLLEVLLGVSRLLEVLLRVSRLLVALWLSLLWGVAGVLSRLLIALVVSGRLVALLGVRLLVALESLTCGWRRRLGRRNGLLLADAESGRLGVAPRDSVTTAPRGVVELPGYGANGRIGLREHPDPAWVGLGCAKVGP
jgi:hypothetical protein